MRIICCLLLLLCSFGVRGQVNVVTNSFDSENYMRLGNGNKTMFKALSITGACLVIIGGGMFLSEMGKSSAEYNESRSRTGETLFYIGGGLIIASIPFRIAYKNELIPGDIKLAAMPRFIRPETVSGFYPSVSLSVKF